MRTDLIPLSALDAALHEGDEDRIVEELRRSGRRDRATILRTLDQTKSARIRNAAALSLADMRAPGAKKELLRLLKQPETRGARGTLLYALDELQARLPLSTLVEIITEDGYEAGEEAINFIARKRVIWDQDAQQAERTLRSALSSASDERANALESALAFLGAGKKRQRASAS